MRWVFIVAGLIALGASCDMALTAAGGISSASAPGLIALVVVLSVGAASIGHALAGRHVAIAVVIGLGMLAGEAGAMLQTAQRVTAAREAMRAPIAAQAMTRQATVDELGKAEAAKPMPANRTRLDTAERAKIEADKAARDKSAEKGCRENCRMLLQSAVDSAAREVEFARAELGTHDAKQATVIAKRIEDAKAALAALPAPQSATPLSDAMGLSESVLDVFEALALSLAINLPASALIALGVKMGAAPRPRLIDTTLATPIEPEPLLTLADNTVKRDATAEAERFGIGMLKPDPKARLSPGDLRGAYLEWCQAAGLDPLPMNEIALALGNLFRKAGIEARDGSVIGVAIKPAR